MNNMNSTPIPTEVGYLEDINKSRRIIDDLELIPEGLKSQNDWREIIEHHEDRIIFYLEQLNQYYRNKNKLTK